MAPRPINLEKRIRIVLIVVLTLIGVYSCSLNAQSVGRIKYLGFQASFGMRSFQVSSNIKEINRMQASHEGGSLGVVFGNEFLKTRFRVAGIFYSNANTPRTQQLFETALLSNFYPLEFLQKNKDSRIQPYLTAGFSMENIKFFGKYLDNPNTQQAYEPYLGKISQLNAQGGIGLEYRLPCQVDFIHLYAEATYAAPIQSQSNNSAFSSTSIRQFTTLNVGVSFGRNR